MTTQQPPPLSRHLKFLMILPLLAAPSIFAAFYAMGGGSGKKSTRPSGATTMGFNMELPKARFDIKESGMNKLAFYIKADEDSAKRKEYLRSDPYRAGLQQHPEDQQADGLLEKLSQLKKSLSANAYAPLRAVKTSRLDSTTQPRATESLKSDKIADLIRSVRAHDTSDKDPQLDRLNQMLEKIIRIQHKEEVPTSEAGVEPLERSIPDRSPEVSPIAIPAVIQEDQTVRNGSTIALRITENTKINSTPIPKGQLLFGLVSINSDRMLVNIISMLYNQCIFLTALQVYDMDGLPGIHIPDMPERQVAKQSAEQGISSMNLTSFDRSLGTQAAAVGIQAAKSLFNRKVRTISVSVRAGYQVFLRNTKSATSTEALLPLSDTIPIAHPDTASSIHLDSVSSIRSDTVSSIRRDSLSPLGQPATQFFPDLAPVYLHRAIENGKMLLILQGVYLRNDMMYLSFLLKNRSPITYTPGFTRYFIRDRRQMKRTAIQEIPLLPVFEKCPTTIPGFTEHTMILAFNPFALPKGKDLTIQMAEENAGRQLNLRINPHILLNAR